MHVSVITPDDRDAVADIARSAGLSVDVEAELARAWCRGFIARAAPDAPPIAFAIAWIVADEVHIIHVGTHPDARRRGAARALVDALVELGRAERARLLLLEVRRSNRAAIALYRSTGFRAIGVRRGYYGDDGEDAIEMMLTLDPVTGDVRRGPDEVAIEGHP